MFSPNTEVQVLANGRFSFRKIRELSPGETFVHRGSVFTCAIEPTRYHDLVGREETLHIQYGDAWYLIVDHGLGRGAYVLNPPTSAFGEVTMDRVEILPDAVVDVLVYKPVEAQAVERIA